MKPALDDDKRVQLELTHDTVHADVIQLRQDIEELMHKKELATQAAQAVLATQS
jgi:hypothetical protein